jgi:menaquinone-dependent protoporphyrinogen oxidase
MSPVVLVAYATKYGATQEVAESIAATLRENRLEVNCLPMRDAQTPSEYGAFVLGAPLYIGAWHKDAVHFVSRYREAIIQRPVAIFALGPVHRDEQEMQGSREQLEHELAKFPWLKPVALEVFVGKYDPARLRFPDSLVPKLPVSPLYNSPPSDERDWTAIRTWASNLAAKFQPAIAPLSDFQNH